MGRQYCKDLFVVLQLKFISKENDYKNTCLLVNASLLSTCVWYCSTVPGRDLHHILTDCYFLFLVPKFLE